MISQELGYEPEETHEILKLKFLKDMGKTNTIHLTTTEFNTYIEKIQRWASLDLSLIIPDPVK